MGAIGKLSAAKVGKTTTPGRYGDGGGLWLQVSQVSTRVTKSWLFRFTLRGKAYQMGLGSLDTFGLAEARQRAEQARKCLADGINPLLARRAERAAALAAEAKLMTFKDCAEAYIAAHRPEWKNAKHAAQWTATLETYVFPRFGSLPVHEIDVALVERALQPIWTKMPETASRVRGRIESVIDWATARKLRTGDNPASWKGSLKHLLPARNKAANVRHHPALPYGDVAGFMADLRRMEGVSARALEFAILTAARTGETVGARWSEVDLDAGLWTIPGDRMKAGKKHSVPLSDPAIAILKALPREKGSDFVFIGDKKGQALSNMALLMTLRRMERADLTTHGFRSTFRDWAAETTSYPNEMLELALAHTVGDKVEAAYRRGHMVEKRRRLMADWATFCDQPVRAGNVSPIRGAAR